MIRKIIEIGEKNTPAAPASSRIGSTGQRKRLPAAKPISQLGQ